MSRVPYNEIAVYGLFLLSLENTVLQLYPKLVFRQEPHLFLDIILHAATKTQSLSDLATPKHQVTSEQHESKQQVPPSIHEPFAKGEILIINQTSTSPRPSHLDAVDRTAQELVIALYNAHVAAYEEEFPREVRFIGEDVTNTLTHAFLDFEVTLCGSETLELASDARFCTGVSSFIRTHQRSRREEVGCFDAPRRGDFAECLIVECHDRFPELTVLVSKLWSHAHI